MTTDTAAGHDLLVAALAQIEMHPESWNQGDWRCETGMCLAGTMADLSPEVTWKNSADDEYYSEVLTLRDGSEMPAGNWAAWVLFDAFVWWDSEDAEGLFHGNNSIEDLRAGVKAVLNGEPVWPAIWADRASRTTP